jgi:hypothetical protein
MFTFIYDPKGNLFSIDTACHKYPEGYKAVSRWDFKEIANARNVAKDATDKTGRLHMATDAGNGCHPRYDVIEAPKVGDQVSYAFNGDAYPDGVITNISKTMKVITTSSGRRFYRRKESGQWKNGKTWSLIPGHVEKRNPHI